MIKDFWSHFKHFGKKFVKPCTLRRKVDIDQYLQTQYLLTSNNHRSRSAGNNEGLLLDRCALRKFHATYSKNPQLRT